MALIVEDGTGKVDAQSYVSVSDCATYHAAKGNSAWAAAASDTLREQALVRGTASLDALFASRWPGFAAGQDQALEWPRYEAYSARGYLLDSDLVPQAVKNAACEAALIELLEPGALSKALDRGGAVQTETVGPLTTTYFPGAPAGIVYRILSQALSAIIPSGGLKVRRG